MIWNRRARELVAERLGLIFGEATVAEVCEDPVAPMMRAVRLKGGRTFLVDVSSDDPAEAVEEVQFKSWPPQSHDGRTLRWHAIGVLAS